MNPCRICGDELLLNTMNGHIVHMESGGEFCSDSIERPRNKKVTIHLLSAQIVHRVKDSEDSVMNDCEVVEILIRNANL